MENYNLIPDFQQEEKFGLNEFADMVRQMTKMAGGGQVASLFTTNGFKGDTHTLNIALEDFISYAMRLRSFQLRGKSADVEALRKELTDTTFKEFLSVNYGRVIEVLQGMEQLQLNASDEVRRCIYNINFLALKDLRDDVRMKYIKMMTSKKDENGNEVGFDEFQYRPPLFIDAMRIIHMPRKAADREVLATYFKWLNKEIIGFDSKKITKHENLFAGLEKTNTDYYPTQIAVEEALLQLYAAEDLRCIDVADKSSKQTIFDMKIEDYEPALCRAAINLAAVPLPQDQASLAYMYYHLKSIESRTFKQSDLIRAKQKQVEAMYSLLVQNKLSNAAEINTLQAKIADIIAQTIPVGEQEHKGGLTGMFKKETDWYASAAEQISDVLNPTSEDTQIIIYHFLHCIDEIDDSIIKIIYDKCLKSKAKDLKKVASKYEGIKDIKRHVCETYIADYKPSLMDKILSFLHLS